MHDALANFVFVEPGRQAKQFNPENLAAESVERLAKGDRAGAVLSLWSLARVGFYNQDREMASAALKEIIMTWESNMQVVATAEHGRTLLNNLDKAMEISKEYYDAIAKSSSSKP